MECICYYSDDDRNCPKFTINFCKMLYLKGYKGASMHYFGTQCPRNPFQSLSIPQVKVYFFNPVSSGHDSTRKRVDSADLVSYTDGQPKTSSLKRHSYDCAVHLDEFSLSNNNEVTESGNEDLSDTDSENETAWPRKEPKPHRKDTYI